mgnify:CR=1 FL=1
MTASIILFVFLIPGMIFSYTLSASTYYINQGQYLSYTYYFNMTWDYTHFDMTVISNVTSVTPPLKPYYNISRFNGTTLSFYDIYYNQYYLPIISLFTNFTLIDYGINNGSVIIPAIKFFNPGGSYMIVSAQYGFPIRIYNETTEKGMKFNFSVKLNFVKPLPSFVKSYNLYKVNITDVVGRSKVTSIVYIVSPSAKMSYYNTVIANQTFGALNISAKGYATVILPISGFPFTEPEGTIYVNGRPYYIIVQLSSIYGEFYYSTTYASTNIPFMGAMIGHYYVLFFPEGGNISIVFSQGKIIDVNVQSSNNSLISYAIYGSLAVVIIIAIIGYIWKKKSK